MTESELTITDSLFRQFKEQLDAFIFFHLGADACLRIEEKVAGLEIEIEHPRVHAFSAGIDPDQLKRMVENPDYFETIMLDYLSRYRRHA